MTQNTPAIVGIAVHGAHKGYFEPLNKNAVVGEQSKTP